MDIPPIIRPVQRSDATDWERMRRQVWPSHPGEHAKEIALYFDGDRRGPAEALTAIEESGQAVGFAELSVRHEKMKTRIFSEDVKLAA